MNGYLTISQALQVLEVVKAIVNLGFFIAAVEVARWAVRIVAGFFDDGGSGRAEWLDTAERIGAAHEAAADARERGDMEAAWIHDQEAENATRLARSQRGG